ncbi:hypothetical protein BZG02_19035 [Labilibaculum filiforme]|uniref:GmrSD restriction endonucleases N-terminal domain-containing protein n=1 Tax=Labilibaculum filiforme TaxID=1940526 RepID=A0A2N3HR75_9BACT|nr:DUF262 domain-containing protein [Labilibaculum filiforme]PKQ60561.1 hypothetical protein BZG02_19035 [Labilibaculum filiforme]
MAVIDNIYIERKTVKWLTDQIKEELLSVDNSFQRQYIWTVKNQAKLIETILMGYAIPEIYLWEQATDSVTGNTELSIIDGQQRLGSIFDFINEKFTLKSSYLDNKDALYANKSFSSLTEDERNIIWKYPISVRFIKVEVHREDIVNMFLRLNSTNTTLNPQELRNAEYNGLFLRLSNELSKIDLWESIGLFTGSEYRRMKDIEFISSLLLFIRFGIEEEVTQTSINKAYDTFNEEYEEYEDDKSLFFEIVDCVNLIVNGDEKVSKFISKKVHFYTLFNLAYYVCRQSSAISSQIIERYKHFVNSYSDLETIKSKLNPSYLELISEYYALCQEGTQRKSNRIRRFEILKEIVENNYTQHAV